MVQDSSFYKTRPKAIQKMIDKTPPTHEYKINETGHVCTIYSYEEGGSITVLREINDIDRVSGKLGDEITHLNVFGLTPEDITKLEDRPIEVDEDDIEHEEMKTIKIQRSLVSSDNSDTMLVYDEARDFEYQGPMTPEMISLMGDKPKIYAEAALTPNKDDNGKLLGTFQFSIVHVIEDQEW